MAKTVVFEDGWALMAVVFQDRFHCIPRTGEVIMTCGPISGTLNAACQLVNQLQGDILECLVVVELADLKGREKVPAKVSSLLQYKDGS